MKTAIGVRSIIKNRGLRQVWVVEQMNKLDPYLNMNPVKFSAIVCGSRKMTGDELIAFCRATDTLVQSRSYDVKVACNLMILRETFVQFLLPL